MSKNNRNIKKISFLASERKEAKDSLKALIARYGNCDAADADVIVALGGDGFMLQSLRRYRTLLKRGLPVYGMNKGTIGFLMNEYEEDHLIERIEKAKDATVSPLKMIATAAGGKFEELAFNEVSLFRETRQAAHIEISVDNRLRLERLIADGILLATPAGSTAYNLSAHGPVLPLGSGILALTPISAFRPRRWRGALLNAQAQVKFRNLDPKKRPLSATADDREIRNVTDVEISLDRSTTITLLFNEDQALDEKILREQFAT